MNVTIRPYINGGWEADIHVQCPDGSVIRERKKVPASSKSAAERWAEARERELAKHGKPKPVQREEVPEKPTLAQFAPRFIERYAKANRLKPSGIAAKRTILQLHLIPAFGNKTLDAIATEDVQEMKAALAERSPKTAKRVDDVECVAQHVRCLQLFK